MIKIKNLKKLFVANKNSIDYLGAHLRGIKMKQQNSIDFHNEQLISEYDNSIEYATKNHDQPEVPAHFITLLRPESSDELPSKEFSLNNGELKKENKGINYRYFNATCFNYKSLNQLKEFIELRDLAGFVPHKNKNCEINSEDSKITRRRQEDFEYSCGLTLDIDLPSKNQLKIKSFDNVMNALAEVFPAFMETDCLWNYSSSSNLLSPTGEPVSTKLGFHIRFMTENIWRAEDLNILVKRLIISGYGFGKKNKNGALSVDTLVDRSTQQSNRVFFESLPILKDNLSRSAGSDDLHYVSRGSMLLPSLSKLTKEEEIEYKDIQKSLKLTKAQELGVLASNGDNYEYKDKKGVSLTVPRKRVDHFIESLGRDDFDLGLEVKTADDKLILIGDIEEKTSIYSPFRDDTHASAFVNRNKDGVVYLHDSATGLTHWPKSALLLDAIIPKESVSLSKQFIGSNLSRKPGITFLKSPVATGKTTALGDYIKDISEDQSVLYICHRTSLTVQVAASHHLTCYKDISFNAVDVPRRLAICVNSVYKLLQKVKLFDHVIIDESEQLIRHLTGSTFSGSNDQTSHRFDIIKYLSVLLKRAKSVLTIDAHLSHLTKSFFGKFVDPEAHSREIVNEFSRYEGNELELYDDGGALLRDFCAAASGEFKVALACDTKKIALAVYRRLSKDFPEKLGLIVTSEGIETSAAEGSPTAVAAQNFNISSLNSLLKDYNYFIYSPSLGTGYSIDDSHFDIVYGHFSYLIPSDNIQQLARVRNAGIRKVYYKNSGIKYEDQLPYIVASEWENSQEIHDILSEEGIRFDYDDNLKKSLNGIDLEYLRLYSTVRYYDYLERKNGVFLLIRLLEDQGYQIIPVEANDASVAEGKNLVMEGNELHQYQRRKGILEASTISNSEAKQRQLRSVLTKSERFELDRYDLENFYHDCISSDLIDFDDEGRMRKALLKFESLFEDEKKLESSDLRAYKQDSAIHVCSKAVRACLLKELCSHFLKFSCFLHLDQAFICNPMLLQSDFVKTCEKYRSLLDRSFRTSVTKDIHKNPAAYVKRIFDEFGIESSSKQKRFSKLPPDLQSAIKNVVKNPPDRIRFIEIDSKHFKRMIDLIGIRKPSLRKYENTST
jgi:hypothetical protein